MPQWPRSSLQRILDHVVDSAEHSGIDRAVLDCTCASDCVCSDPESTCCLQAELEEMGAAIVQQQQAAAQKETAAQQQLLAAVQLVEQMQADCQSALDQEHRQQQADLRQQDATHEVQGMIGFHLHHSCVLSHSSLCSGPHAASHGHHSGARNTAG